MNNVAEMTNACAGCAACVDACPAGALQMQAGEYGFYLPKVDDAKCVKCGACTGVCPMLNPPQEVGERKYYYGWHNDEAIRASSSSGGIFSALAMKVLAEDGVVFGTAYDPDFKSASVCSTEEKGLDELRISKYVQSDAEGSISAIRQLVESGRSVLYCGTPCQIAGARNALGQETEHLILVDFLCGGAASPQCYREYVEWLEKRHGSQVKKINFRSKRKGWVRAGIQVEFDNGGSYYSGWEYDPYYRYFCGTPYLKNLACMECPFRTSRAADITIADFWGFRAKGIEHDDKGMSLVVTHTARGARLLERISDDATLLPLTKEEAEYDFVERKFAPEVVMARRSFLNEATRDGFICAAYRHEYKGGRMGVIVRKIEKRIKRMLRQ